MLKRYFSRSNPNLGFLLAYYHLCIMIRKPSPALPLPACFTCRPLWHAYVLGIALFVLATTTGCDRNPTPNPDALTLLQTVDLDLTEPSGLSLSDNPNQLFAVSDDDNRIYRIGLDGTSQVLSFGGQDLEGICQNLNDRTLWVVEEENQFLLHLDVNGNPMDTIVIDYLRQEVNHGPEGVAIDPANNRLFIVTEKQPGMLLTMDLQGNITDEVVLDFAGDYSAISYAPSENLLYILSDQAQTITQCDLAGKALESYQLTILKGEGLAVDIPNNRFYVVSDDAAELYLYERN